MKWKLRFLRVFGGRPWAIEKCKLLLDLRTTRSRRKFGCLLLTGSPGKKEEAPLQKGMRHGCAMCRSSLKLKVPDFCLQSSNACDNLSFYVQKCGRNMNQPQQRYLIIFVKHCLFFNVLPIKQSRTLCFRIESKGGILTKFLCVFKRRSPQLFRSSALPVPDQI